MGNIDQNTCNDTAIRKMKVFKNNLVKRIDTFNSYNNYETEKKYTENNTEPDTENNTKPVTKRVVKKKNTNPDTNPDTKPDNDPATNDDIRASIIDKQKTIKKDTKVYYKQRKLSKIKLIRYITR